MKQEKKALEAAAKALVEEKEKSKVRLPSLSKPRKRNPSKQNTASTTPSP
jgi:hypothetical protein